MTTARPLLLSHAELISEDMQQLAPSVRFTAMTLRAHLATYGTNGRARLNLTRLKGLYFSLDEQVTTRTLETDVLELASIGVVDLSTDAEGADWYGFARFDPPAPEARETPPTAPSGPFIGTVKREQREERDGSEREGASEAPEGPPQAAPIDPGPPPPMFCPDHRPNGALGGHCVVCRDFRMGWETWSALRLEYARHRAEQVARRNTRRSPRFEEDDDA